MFGKAGAGVLGAAVGLIFIDGVDGEGLGGICAPLPVSGPRLGGAAAG